MGFLCFGYRSHLIIKSANDFSVLDDDIFTIVFGHHLGLICEVVIKFFFKRTFHMASILTEDNVGKRNYNSSMFFRF